MRGQVLPPNRMITADTVDKALAVQLATLHEQIYHLRRQEVEAFYQANKARLKVHEASLREQIRTFFQNQKLARAR